MPRDDEAIEHYRWALDLFRRNDARFAEYFDEVPHVRASESSRGNVCAAPGQAGRNARPESASQTVGKSVEVGVVAPAARPLREDR